MLLNYKNIFFKFPENLSKNIPCFVVSDITSVNTDKHNYKCWMSLLTRDYKNIPGSSFHHIIIIKNLITISLLSNYSKLISLFKE